MTSIILVHTFAPHPDEHYTALPGEEGQPVSYVRRVLVEGSAAQALDLAGGFLREGEAVANTYEVRPAHAKPIQDAAEEWMAEDRPVTEIRVAMGPPKSAKPRKSA